METIDWNCIAGKQFNRKIVYGHVFFSSFVCSVVLQHQLLLCILSILFFFVRWFLFSHIIWNICVEFKVLISFLLEWFRFELDWNGKNGTHAHIYTKKLVDRNYTKNIASFFSQKKKKFEKNLDVFKKFLSKYHLMPFGAHTYRKEDSISFYEETILISRFKLDINSEKWTYRMYT